MESGLHIELSNEEETRILTLRKRSAKALEGESGYRPDYINYWVFLDRNTAGKQYQIEYSMDYNKVEKMFFETVGRLVCVGRKEYKRTSSTEAE